MTDVRRTDLIQGDPGPAGAAGPAGPAGPPGTGSVERAAAAAISAARSVLTTGTSQKVTAATAAANTPLGSVEMRSRQFLGVNLNAVLQDATATVQTYGPLPRAAQALAAGVRCAVGTTVAGALVRATDSTCASAPNWIGVVDYDGNITVTPWRAESLNVLDFGADPRGPLSIIASSTNASPIAITTSEDHKLQTGQRVNIASHATNTAANGFWTITVTSATTFTLDGSTGNGVGGATGTIQVDSTPAFLAAMRAFNPAELDIAGRIRVPIGSYLVADVKFDRPVIIVGDGGTAAPLYAASRIDVPAGRSGFIFTVNAGRSMWSHVQINALGKNTTTGVGSTTALLENPGASYTLTMSSGASNFAVGDRIRVHGAGWRNNFRSANLIITSGSAVVTCTKHNHGLYVGQWILPSQGFAAPVQIVSIDPIDGGAGTDNKRMTLSAASTVTNATGVPFDFYGDVFTEIVAKSGNNITMLSSADTTRTDILVEHADTGVVMYGGSRGEHSAVKSFQGPGVHVHGNHADQVVTNANLWALNCVDVHFNLHGVFVDGIDGNAGIGTMIIGNGNRLWTIYDDSFLGNSWIQCHAAPYAGDVPPFRAFTSRDASFTRSTFVACYIEDGSACVFGRGTNTLGGFMDINPGGHALVDGTASDFLVGLCDGAASYSEVQVSFLPGGWSETKAMAFKAKSRTEFTLRRTGTGDGAAGFWALMGASAAGKIAFAIADDDAVAPFNSRVGGMWLPYGARFGGGESNGTLDATKAKLIEFNTASPYGEAGRQGDVRYKADYTVGSPMGWRCTTTGTAGSYGAGGVAVWRAIRGEWFDQWVTTNQNVFVDDWDYRYFVNTAGTVTITLQSQSYPGKRVCVSARGGGTVTIDGSGAQIVGGGASGTTHVVANNTIRVVEWNGSTWDVIQ